MHRILLRLGGLFLRRSNVEFGRYRLISILLPWMRRVGPRMGKNLIKTRHGFRFNADCADWLGQHVFLTGTYEPQTAAMFARLIRPGNTVLDVGANVGFFTLLSAKLVGSSGRVLAFEPVPSVRESLVENIGLNGFDQVTVVPKAVSDRSEILRIYEGPEGHKGISSLRQLESVSATHSVETIALDDADFQFDSLGFIKIDVEGAEMRALVGMERLVRKFSPSLVIEFTDKYLRSFGDSVDRMADWLTGCGYRLYRITSDGLVPLDLADPRLPQQYNVLACTSLPGGLSG